MSSGFEPFEMAFLTISIRAVVLPVPGGPYIFCEECVLKTFPNGSLSLVSISSFDFFFTPSSEKSNSLLFGVLSISQPSSVISGLFSLSGLCNELSIIFSLLVSVLG